MSIRKIHENKIGKVSDKWDSYLDFYDNLFQPYKNNPISMLEIGVQNGGSLETYADYFEGAEHIIGCDINQNCAKLTYQDKRIKVIIGDANAEETKKSILGIKNQFDFIIDDGSHISSDILNSFLYYFSILKPGGIYIIEDTHTLYDRSYGGGVLNGFSATEFFKKLIDVVNFEWWSSDISLENYLSTFFKRGLPPFIRDGWVQSLEFHNSIIVIRKAIQPTHKKLGVRRICGTEYAVFDNSYAKDSSAYKKKIT
jgi:hypothetical protein